MWLIFFFSLQKWQNLLVEEFVGKLQVIAICSEKMQLLVLVHLLEPQQVLTEGQLIFQKIV